jgi:RNA polymerase sigma-70 factor (family 1)
MLPKKFSLLQLKMHTEQMTLPHDQLLARLKQGDERAFRAIFDTYYRGLTGDAYRYVHDWAFAEDIVQDVFANIWTKRTQLTITGSLQHYLRRAVINQSLNHIKKNNNFVFEEDADLLDQADDQFLSLDSESEYTIREDKMRAVIEGLPDRCRVVFELSRFENLSHKEIADQLSISTKTVENQITKAMNTLRNVFLRGTSLPLLIFFDIFSNKLPPYVGDLFGLLS